MSRMLPSLAAEPENRFTEASADWVGGRLKRTPNYAELKTVLDQYGRTIAVDSGSPIPLDDTEDRVWAQLWLQHREARDLTLRQLEYRLELTRQHKPKAFYYLIHGDNLAAEIAVRRRWQPTMDITPHTPEEIAHVAQSARQAIAAIREVSAGLGSSVQGRPRGSGGEDSDDDNTAAAQRDALGRGHDDAPRYLTPEQLDRINPLPNGAKRA
jgi:hypothetical protein